MDATIKELYNVQAMNTDLCVKMDSILHNLSIQTPLPDFTIHYCNNTVEAYENRNGSYLCISLSVDDHVFVEHTYSYPLIEEKNTEYYDVNGGCWKTVREVSQHIKDYTVSESMFAQVVIDIIADHCRLVEQNSPAVRTVWP